MKSCSHFLFAIENILGRGVVMDSGDEQQPISLVTCDNAFYCIDWHLIIAGKQTLMLGALGTERETEIITGQLI